MRQPVIAHGLLKLPTTTVRSASSGCRQAKRSNPSSNTRSAYTSSHTTTRSRRSARAATASRLSASSTQPVGLLGEFKTIARVRGVTAAASMSARSWKFVFSAGNATGTPWSSATCEA